jgi:TP901 family phage tail tape measure protein
MSRFVLTAQLQLQAPTNTAQVVRQIQSQLNNVQVNVQVQGTAQATRQVQQVAQSLNAANSAASNLGRTFAISVKRFTALAVATRAVSLFTNTLSNAVNEAIDFERQLIKVAQVTGQTIGELRFLTKSITDLSTGLGVSSKDLLNTSQLLLQAGVSARDTEVALKTLAKAALAPNFDSLSETTEGAIAILAQFQEGVGSLEGQLSSINAVAGAFAVEAGDLIDVIRRTGGVFKASGGSLNELIALFTSVRATTRESAESIGTGLRTIFTRIQRPKTIEFLKQFGVELVDLEGKFVGPFEAVRRLSEALTGLGERDITFIRIAEELGGFRQIGKVLPLLQQFKTSQDALNVAQKAGNGLTKDAETAQQALAVRITKVQEEFLALIRSISETSSFQFFANTTLNLASALIKLADALKPIIPLLTAVATIKLAQGLSSFVGGFGRGIGSGRTFNKGGKVLGFARGGMVPGSGNRDTVPAMLQPGEFVIRKSSVNKLGAGNLAAMNQNRYASGGLIIKQTLSDQYAGLFAKPKGNDSSGKPISIPLTSKGTEGQEILAAIGSPKSYFIGNTDESTFEANAQNKLTSAITEISNDLGGPEVPSGNLRQQLIDAIGVKDIAGKIFEGVARTIAGNFSGAPGASFDIPRGTINNTEALYRMFNAGQNMPNIDYDAKLSESRDNRASLLKKAINNNLFGQDISLTSFKRKLSTEELLRLPKGDDRNQALIQRRQELQTASNNASKLIQDNEVEKIIQSRIQAQARLLSKTIPITAKLKSNKKFFGGLIQKFATGGSVGTDTVPALLTPGEFVVNKKSAQSIGYGALGRMNKVGKYAKGGIVQHFASGDRVLPAQRTVSKEQRKFLIEQYKASQSTDIVPTTRQEKDALSGKLEARSNQDSLKIIKDRYDKLYKEEKQLLSKIYSEKAEEARKQGKDTTKILDEYKKALSEAKQAFTTGAKKALEEEKTVNKQKATDISSNVGKSTPQQKILQTTLEQKARSGQLTTSDLGKGVQAGLDKAILKNINSLNAQTIASQKAAAADTQESSASSRAAQADEREATSSNKTSSMFGGVGSGLTLVTASLQSLLPPIDENSSSLLKMSHSLLTLATMAGSVIFALEAFGISLTGPTMASIASAAGLFLSGTAGTALAASSTTAATTLLGLSVSSTGASASLYNLAASALQASGALLAPLLNFVGPLVAGAAAAYLVTTAFNALASSMFSVSDQLKKSIEAGDITKTEQLAKQEAGLQSANDSRTGFGAIGGTIGATIGASFGTVIAGTLASVVPVFGTAAGAVLGNVAGAAIGGTIGSALGVITGTIASSFAEVGVLFGGNTQESTVAMYVAQASAAKAAKSLEKASIDSAKALQNFENGTGSALDVLSATSQAASDATLNRKKAEDAIAKNEKNKSGFFGGFGRGALRVGTLGIAGLAGVESGAQRNARIDKENKTLDTESKKAQQDVYEKSVPGLQVLQRQVAATGGSFEDFLAKVKEANPALADYIQKQGSGTLGLVQSFENLSKEAERTRNAFNAMNLGFQKVSAVSGALSVGLENYLSSQEAGYSALDNTIRTLEASVTNAAQGISDVDFSASLGSASDGLRKLGASENQIKKFEENLTAINTAQKFYAQASEEVKNKLIADFKAGRGADLSAVGKREKFADVISDQLGAAGIGDEAKKRISDAIKGANIEETDLTKILEGDLSALDKVLKDLGETTLNQVIGPLKELAKYEQTLANLTKKRIELENNLISSQRGVLQANLEAQEIIGKYGGPAVTSETRTQNALMQANVQAQGTGVGALRTGSAAELNARSKQIRAGLANIGNIRTQAASGNAAAQQQLAGKSGVALEAQEKRLLELAKSDYDTTKLLIQNKEEELKLLGEKNKLEKDSIDALVSGDIDKFFEQQAAAGAQAAIALGSDRLQGAFGANALGAAAQDIKRQQEAGQQTLFGQQLAGAGGLTERAFGAAIGARGITDPRLAQIAAGTTAEENAAQSEIRDLAGTLPNYANTQLDSSQIELQAANNQMIAAEKQLEAARANVEERSGGVGVAAMARGGLIYANRGIFVPRGTDTVPAMLTPGEFVVRREAVQRGNNLQMLQAMNRGSSTGQSSIGSAVGMANGGMVRYRADGSTGPESGGMGLNTEVITRLAQSLDKFNTDLSSNIDKLNSTNFNIKLDTTNVNVNLTGSSFLSKMKDELRDELMREIGNKITNYKSGEGGSLRENRSVLGLA